MGEYLVGSEAQLYHCAESSSHVFDGCSQQPDLFVDDEVAVVDCVRELYFLYWGTLLVVLLEVEFRLLVVAGVYGAFDSVGAFVQQQHGAFVDERVYEYESFLCRAYKVGYEGIGVPYTAGGEELFSDRPLPADEEVYLLLVVFDLSFKCSETLLH